MSLVPCLCTTVAVAKSFHFQWLIAVLSAASFWCLCPYKVEKIVCRSQVQHCKPSAQNSSCLPAKKMCCLRSRSFPTLPFRQNVCLGEHSGGWLLVCFLLQFLLVFCFPGWFCCFSVLFFFVCFGSVLLYIKRAELEKTSGQGDESFMSPNPCLGIQSPEI